MTEVIKMKMTKYEYLNMINNKYNLYIFDITCYQEAYEFWEIFNTIYGLGIPAVPITEKEAENVLYIIDNWFGK